MRWRQVGLLYAVLAILAVLYARERGAGTPAEPERPARPRFLQVPAADVAEITMRRGDRLGRDHRREERCAGNERAEAGMPRGLPTG
jgi:stringent starvation protein B